MIYAGASTHLLCAEPAFHQCLVFMTPSSALCRCMSFSALDQDVELHVWYLSGMIVRFHPVAR